MDLRREDLKRTARAPAKLNLLLDLLGRRDDGFHELETLMVPIRLADTVSFLPVPSASSLPAEIQLEVRMCQPARFSGEAAPIPSGPENLVVRVLELLRQRSGCESGARVELTKRIPAAAGLGGGSSDAAAAMRLANRGWRLNWTVDRLAEVAAEIGSDIPYFLYGGVAICRGRGERVEKLPAISPLHFVVVKPPVELKTGEVYRAYDGLSEQSDRPSARTGEFVRIARAALIGRGRGLAGAMRNSLQRAAGTLSPWVNRIAEIFNQFDFLGHQLSGSGSAYFGVCRHAQHARRLANILRTRQLGLIYATRSC